MSKIDLPRLAAMVFNTPLMMDRNRLDTALRALGPRILEGVDIEPAATVAPERQRHAYARDAGRYFSAGGYMWGEGLAVLPILGTMSRRATWLDSYCGMTSYEAVRDAATEILTDGSVRGLMLELDTGGGEAGGCFDTADLIKRLSEATGKPVWAHANENALSAGYALACSAETVWLSRTAEVGSVGVVCAHVDVSEADAKAGVQWTYIFAGDKKVDGNMHEPLSESALNDFQADVDDLAADFYSLVALNRGLDVEQVRAMQAGIFRGAKALEAKLADEIGTFDEAMQAFAEHVDELQTTGAGVASLSKVRSQVMASGSRGTKPQAVTEPKPEDDTKDKPVGTETSEDGKDKDVEEDEGKDKPEASVPAPAADPAAAAAAAERARCNELSEISTQASRLGVPFNLAEAINKGTSAAAARSAVLAAAADKDSANETVSAQPGAERQKAASKEATRTMWGKALKRRR